MIDVCMMNEPTQNELAAITRCIKLLGLMYSYIPTSQYVWTSSVLVSQFFTGVWVFLARGFEK